MIQINYQNVMNGFNKSVHMRCICPTRMEAERLFHNAVALWYVDGFSLCRHVDLEINYGPNKNRTALQFLVLEPMYNSSWRGFHGIYLFHHNIKKEELMPRYQSMIEEIEWHNERHLEKWRA